MKFLLTMVRVNIPDERNRLACVGAADCCQGVNSNVNVT